MQVEKAPVTIKANVAKADAETMKKQIEAGEGFGRALPGPDDVRGMPSDGGCGHSCLFCFRARASGVPEYGAGASLCAHPPRNHADACVVPVCMLLTAGAKVELL